MTTPSTLAQFLSATPFQMMQRGLPNGGGSYSSPVIAQPTKPVAPPPVKPLFPSGTSTVATQTQAPDMTQYLNPNTGVPYTPAEYADTVAAKLTQAQTGPDVPNYAGNQLTEASQTTDQLTNTATDLNNAENDIKTGTTDPYKVAGASGIAYSPAELKAIESAYAGIYDPALKSALNKLTDKQKADTAAQTLKDSEAKTVFDTNEAIRQWRATTGSKADSTDASFTNDQINAAAGKLGMLISDFKGLDPDLKNFFIHEPNGADPSGAKDTNGDPVLKPMGTVFQWYIDNEPDKAAALIASSTLPAVVKAYYINKIPPTVVDTSTKKSLIDSIFGKINPVVSDAIGGLGNWLNGK